MVDGAEEADEENTFKFLNGEIPLLFRYPYSIREK